MSDGEFAWIQELAAQFGAGRFPDGVYGIGDDAAIIPAKVMGASTEEARWVVSVDSQVSGVHFQPGWLSWPDMGRRLLHVGFSDIAAMGALPSLALVSVEVGVEVTAGHRQEFAEGIAAACAEMDVRLIGGNVSGRKEGFSAHVTAIGVLERSAPLLRSGALPDDAIFVTGHLGAAAAGVEILRDGRSENSSAAQALVDAYRHPRAHWRGGLALAGMSWVHAAIDVSDGLAADLGHLCQAGGVGAVLDGGAIPVSPAVVEWCRETGCDPLDRALAGGEDYVLLFAAPPNALKERELKERFASFGGEVWRIGTITASGPPSINRGGKQEHLTPHGYDHLARGNDAQR
jgi:thiamine-monophosphate kinase